jgi:hypothetical protein
MRAELVEIDLMEMSLERRGSENGTAHRGSIETLTD